MAVALTNSAHVYAVAFLSPIILCVKLFLLLILCSLLPSNMLSTVNKTYIFCSCHFLDTLGVSSDINLTVKAIISFVFPCYYRLLPGARLPCGEANCVCIGELKANESERSVSLNGFTWNIKRQAQDLG